jgi:uncharacterized protein YhfF
MDRLFDLGDLGVEHYQSDSQMIFPGIRRGSSLDTEMEVLCNEFSPS